MKNLVLLLIAGLIAGCGDETSSASPSIAPSASVASPTPTSSGPSPSDSPSPSPSSTAHPTLPPGTSDINLRRTHQLKDLKKITLRIGKVHIKAWVMDTEGKRAEGMMWLTEKEVKADEGMLFVFGGRQRLSFWMQNTLISLDLMFVDENKKIINILPGKPLDESPIPADRLGQYVIEMKVGSANRLGIKAGDSVGIPDDVKSVD